MQSATLIVKHGTSSASLQSTHSYRVRLQHFVSRYHPTTKYNSMYNFVWSTKRFWNNFGTLTFVFKCEPNYQNSSASTLPALLLLVAVCRPFCFGAKYSLRDFLTKLQFEQLFLSLQNQQPSMSSQNHLGMVGGFLRFVFPIQTSSSHHSKCFFTYFVLLQLKWELFLDMQSLSNQLSYA